MITAAVNNVVGHHVAVKLVAVVKIIITIMVEMDYLVSMDVLQ